MGKKDFFVSYNKSNHGIAEWIAWVLEDAGHSTLIQAWDFLAGVSFPLAMQKASEQCVHTIAVLSQAYLDALFTQPEWAAAFIQDPTGEQGILIPIRVEDFDPKGMIGTFVYIDLVGLNEDDAKKRLLDEIAHKRRKPESKPSFRPIAKKTFRPKPSFEPIPLSLHQLSLGATDELVGRKEALAWLEKQLFDGKGSACALASLQGAGGMGKTFLAQAFAEKNKERANFLPIYLGETKPFDAGLMVLRLQGIETAAIDDEEKLKAGLHAFYSAGSGIVFLDDVRSEDASLLLPQVDSWRVLMTTRDKPLARTLCGERNVKELDVLSPNESLTLMRNVLGEKFIEDRVSDYAALCAYLAHRPYSIRLSAGYLLNCLDPCPKKLLDRLMADPSAAIDDQYSFEKLAVLLRDCLGQLKAKSLLGAGLVRLLSVCADKGMALNRFVQWQKTAGRGSDGEIEQGLVAARDLGVILVETEKGDSQIKNLRLHTDMLRVLREDKQVAEVGSLMDFLEDLLVTRKFGKELDRQMHEQVFSLVERFGEDEGVVRGLYDKFWVHLWRTGELKQAFELGEKFGKQTEVKGDKYDLQRSYSNQALILRVWGRLDEAMELHKKQEAICIELGNKDNLWKSYCNQATVQYYQGRLNEAMELYKKQEVICIELGNKDGLGDSYSGQALVLQAQGRLDQAINFHKRQEAICIKLGDKDSLGKSYCNQATIQYYQGRLDEAMELYKKQEVICIELGNKDGLGDSYSGQALVLQAQGRLDQAIDFHKKQEAICVELGNKDGLQRSYGNQALILQNWGRLEEAIELLKKTELICIEAGLKPSLIWSYKAQFSLLSQSNRTVEAAAVRKKLAALEKVTKA
jgi:tetratricopeptide (TPR) repeat protein